MLEHKNNYYSNNEFLRGSDMIERSVMDPVFSKMNEIRINKRQTNKFNYQDNPNKSPNQSFL